MRAILRWAAVCCLTAVRTLTYAGPHEDGIAAGQAANPIIRGGVDATSAATVVPGYTATPAERAYFRHPDLSGQANVRLAACALTPTDPVCEAQRGALASANTAREAVTAFDPSVAPAKAIARHPALELGSLAAYYAGCTTTDVVSPATTEARLCHRYAGIGNLRCTRTLIVGTADTTADDRWQDSCPEEASGGRCTLASADVCVDGPSTRQIDGRDVTRACWRYERTLSCASGAPVNECAALAASGCTPSASTCAQMNTVTGTCDLFQDTYQCPVPAQTTTTATNCPSNVFCLGNSCFNTSSPADADFARAMTYLEAAREAGVYLDTDRLQVFKGERNRCRDRLLTNCCTADNAGTGMNNRSVFGLGSRLVYDVLMNADNRDFVYQGVQALLTNAGFNGSFSSYGVTVAVNGTALPAGSVTLFAGDSMAIAVDPWSLAITAVMYVITSATSCDEEEGKLAMKEGARLCHTVGSYCSTCLRVLGRCVSCLTQSTAKCCFNSVLARLVNQQGRAQVGRDWGAAENPDCSGFTIAQLQALDFAAMDLTEFYASLVPSLPNVANMQSTNTARVAHLVARPRPAPLPGATPARPRPRPSGRPPRPPGSTGPGPTPPPRNDNVAPYGQDPTQYASTFSEEFEAGLDPSLWNDTIWYEPSNPTKNYTVEDGVLKIWPARDSSGRFFNRTIDTDGHYTQTYGYFEIEAKLPMGKGTWPAFWLFNHIGSRRPEIDVMEAYAGGVPPWGFIDGDGVAHPQAYSPTVWKGDVEGQRVGFRQFDTGMDLSAGFHKYAVKWEPNRQTFYFDGQEVLTLDVAMGDPMYLMLDLWYGADSGEPDDSTPTGKANSYEINYVRAWEFR